MARPAKRMVFKAIVLLLLGAILNIALAWGCAATWPLNGRKSQMANQYLNQSKEWRVIRIDRPGLIQIESGYWSVVGPSDDSTLLPSQLIPNASELMDVITNRPPVMNQMEWEVLAGWPQPCLSGMKHNEWHFGPYKSEYRKHSLSLASSPPPAQFKSSGDYREKLLPLRPLWLGMTINTIFYAAILWLLFFIPGKVRRAIRRRRGLCPACAYPTRGGTSPVCTECGEPLRQRSAISDQQSALDNQS